MYKALIVDDEKHVSQAIIALGEWEKYSIKEPFYASNGQDGLTAMREIRPNIVFVDMKMPIIDGREFLKLATAEFSDVQYIVISGYNEFELARAALKFSVIDYLLKPIDEDELNSAIGKAICNLNKNSSDELRKNEKQEIKIEVKNENTSPKYITKEIKHYIDENYFKEITLSMFSDKYHFSKEYLTKIFKEHYDCGIYEYALNMKMSRARELLRDSEVSINEISLRLGYSNNNYFSKAFKNFHGYSPSKYREKIINEDK
ncbi:MAG: helix-turn-helix domain-containing protein [Bacillota bacterium]|nr:helix-turn-helix domain-containing protein [Bacillota bacterium]